MKLQESIDKLKEIREVAKTYGVVTISEGDSRAIDTVVEYCEKQLPCDCVIGFEGDIPVTHKLCDNCKSKIWGSVCPINSSIIIEKCVYRGEKCSVCIK